MEENITPPKGLVRIDWAELWRFRDLFVVLAWRDMSVRYKQTLLGVAWAVLQPVTTIVIFSFIFNRVAGIQTGDTTPYPVFLCVGQVLWQYFSTTLVNASQSMVTNAALVQKVYFPRLILPVTSVSTGLIDLAIASMVLAAMMVWYGVAPSWIGLLALPLILLTVVLSSLGFGFFLSAVNVKYRDVRYALPFVINVLMYVTPVIYPLSMLDRYPVAKMIMTWLNPVAGCISNARAILLRQGDIQWDILAISLTVSIIYLLLGLVYFRSTERYFSDVA